MEVDDCSRIWHIYKWDLKNTFYYLWYNVPTTSGMDTIFLEKKVKVDHDIYMVNDNELLKWKNSSWTIWKYCYFVKKKYTNEQRNDDDDDGLDNRIANEMEIKQEFIKKNE